MGERPGKAFEMSSHFFPIPRSWIIKASSSGVHLDCLLAGDVGACKYARFFDELDGVGGKNGLSSGIFGKTMSVLS